MAANQYLKVAAGQLRRAAEFMHRESSKMLSEQTRLATQKKLEISKHENDLRADKLALSQQISSSNSNPNYQRQLTMETRALEQQISMKKSQLQKLNDQLANTARAKEQAAQSLLNRARDLEVQSSAPIFSS